MKIRYFLICFVLVILSGKLLFAQLQPVDLIATDTFGIVGQEVTIDIKVNGFTDIISFQASINWDPAIIGFVEVSNFGIKDLDINNFGTSSADQGHVRFLWEPQDAVAVTLEDGSVLFSATFQVLSDNQTTVIIDFEDKVSTDPFPIEFANNNYDILNVNTTNGTITVFSTASDAVNIISTSNTSCDVKSPNGSLEADVNGNQGSFTFKWYKGNEVTAATDFTGSLFDQLEAGEYTLQVIGPDTEIFVEKMNVTVLEDPAETPDVITELTNMPQQSCSDDPANFTGVLEIEVNNDQPADTYDISWWKGDAETGDELTAFANLYKADLLDAGNYEVVVENLSTTCKSYFSGVVAESPVYPTPEITLKNDTLYANYDNANWLKDESPLNIEAPYLVPDEGGWYSISVTNEYQCSNTSDPYNYNITELEETMAGISIYPNPFTQYVRISNPGEIIDNIFIYDTKGLLLQEIFDVKQKFIDLHINGSSDGFYLLKIQAGDKFLERKVFKNFTK